MEIASKNIQNYLLHMKEIAEHKYKNSNMKVYSSYILWKEEQTKIQMA